MTYINMHFVDSIICFNKRNQGGKIVILFIRLNSFNYVTCTNLVIAFLKIYSKVKTLNISRTKLDRTILTSFLEH